MSKYLKYQKNGISALGTKSACIHINFGQILKGYVSASGFFWFRVFGAGIKGKNVNNHPLMFSERNGYTKQMKVGSWLFSILKRNR